VLQKWDKWTWSSSIWSNKVHGQWIREPRSGPRNILPAWITSQRVQLVVCCKNWSKINCFLFFIWGWKVPFLYIIHRWLHGHRRKQSRTFCDQQLEWTSVINYQSINSRVFEFLYQKKSSAQQSKIPKLETLGGRQRAPEFFFKILWMGLYSGHFWARLVKKLRKSKTSTFFCCMAVGFFLKSDVLKSKKMLA